MKIQDLDAIIKEEDLKDANICDATHPKPNQVVITQEDGKWKVYNTSERAGVIGVVCYFDSEDEACEDFIKKLRFHKRGKELEKIIWEKRHDASLNESKPVIKNTSKKPWIAICIAIFAIAFVIYKLIVLNIVLFLLTIS